MLWLDQFTLIVFGGKVTSLISVQCAHPSLPEFVRTPGWKLHLCDQSMHITLDPEETTTSREQAEPSSVSSFSSRFQGQSVTGKHNENLVNISTLHVDPTTFAPSLSAPDITVDPLSLLARGQLTWNQPQHWWPWHLQFHYWSQHWYSHIRVKPVSADMAANSGDHRLRKRRDSTPPEMRSPTLLPRGSDAGQSGSGPAKTTMSIYRLKIIPHGAS